MNEKLFITASCTLSDQKVILNGKEHHFQANTFHEFITAVYQHFSVCYPKFYKMDNLSKLGFISTELLLKEISLEKFDLNKTGIILSNSASSLDCDLTHQQTISDRKNYFPSPAVFVYTLPNIMIGEICIKHKITGEGTFFVHKQFDAGFLHQYITQLFTDNVIESCITGWVEQYRENYQSVVYFIEKRQTNDGFVIFEPSEMTKIYSEIN
ncbi:MAG: 3-oxoacyl-ACP synthase [Bacteroidales bacterium]|nr:3-oxoacyl-ACP synthase [Bacteroidales bacterium]